MSKVRIGEVHRDRRSFDVPDTMDVPLIKPGGNGAKMVQAVSADQVNLALGDGIIEDPVTGERTSSHLVILVMGVGREGAVFHAMDAHLAEQLGNELIQLGKAIREGTVGEIAGQGREVELDS